MSGRRFARKARAPERVENQFTRSALVAFSLVNLSVVSVYLVQRKRRGPAAGTIYGVVPVIGFALTLWLWTNLTEGALFFGMAWVALGVFYLGILTRGFRQQPPSLEVQE